MISLGETVIIGGGCYGSFYLSQLDIARQRGTVRWDRLLVVDRDPQCQAAALVNPVPGAELRIATWDDFLDEWLEPAVGSRSADDRIVPSPMMPHLMADWLTRRLRRGWPHLSISPAAAEQPFDTPFDRLHPGDGVRYVSHADWLCPVHCIEPGRCPVIRGPRTWEMGDTVTEWATQHGAAATVLFTCRHVVHGVGMYPARLATEAVAAVAPVAVRPAGGDVVVGSVSACHGAVAVVRMRPK